MQVQHRKCCGTRNQFTNQALTWCNRKVVNNFTKITADYIERVQNHRHALSPWNNPERAGDNWNHLLVSEWTQPPGRSIDCVSLPVGRLKVNYEKMIDSPLIVNLTCARLCLTQPIEYLIEFGCTFRLKWNRRISVLLLDSLKLNFMWVTSIACEVGVFLFWFCYCFPLFVNFSVFISSLNTIKFLIYNFVEFFFQMRKHVMNM